MNFWCFFSSFFTSQCNSSNQKRLPFWWYILYTESTKGPLPSLPSLIHRLRLLLLFLLFPLLLWLWLLLLFFFGCGFFSSFFSSRFFSGYGFSPLLLRLRLRLLASSPLLLWLQFLLIFLLRLFLLRLLGVLSWEQGELLAMNTENISRRFLIILFF